MTQRSFAACQVWMVMLIASGCVGSSPPEISGLRSVSAKIDGITCPTCVPPLDAALRRQFAGAAAVDIDEKEKTAVVRFASADATATPASFGEAVRQIKMRVVTLDVDACGSVETKGGDQWLVAGPNRFVIRPSVDVASNQPLCIKGQVDSTTDPPTLKVSSFEPQTTH